MHPAAGGAEKHLHRIFSLIAARGHNVVLLTTMFPNARKREIVDGIQVIRKGGDLLFQLTVARTLKKLDAEFKFDVIYEDLNKLPLFTPHLTKKPVLVQMHHLWRSSIFAEAFFPVALGVWLFERAIPYIYKRQPFVVVSPSTRKELCELGVPESRISVVYNGSEPVPEVTVPINEDPYFLWLSRVHRYKGIWTALEAFSIFSQKHPNVRMKIAGDGPLLREIPEWLKENGLLDRVDLCGFVSLEDKHILMAGAIALLQTSFKEGWGLTVVEAGRYGRPTIASDVPGLQDSVINGTTGLLFPVENSEACADCMTKLYENPSSRETMGAAAKAYAEQFSWDRAADETLELLKRAAWGEKA